MSAARTLAALPAFRDCSAASLNSFVRVAPPVRFKSRSLLIAQGKPAEGAFLVVKGRVRAEMQSGDQRMVIGFAGPGEVIGELGLYTAGAVRSATVIAEDDVEALVLDHQLLSRPEAQDVLAVIERRALSSMADRVRKATGTERHYDENSADEPSASWISGMMIKLRKMVGG